MAGQGFVRRVRDRRSQCCGHGVQFLRAPFSHHHVHRDSNGGGKVQGWGCGCQREVVPQGWSQGDHPAPAWSEGKEPYEDPRHPDAGQKALQSITCAVAVEEGDDLALEVGIGASVVFVGCPRGVVDQRAPNLLGESVGGVKGENRPGRMPVQRGALADRVDQRFDVVQFPLEGPGTDVGRVAAPTPVVRHRSEPPAQALRPLSDGEERPVTGRAHDHDERRAVAVRFVRDPGAVARGDCLVHEKHLSGLDGLITRNHVLTDEDGEVATRSE